MLKINQRVSGLRFASLGGGGTNGETKRPCRFRVHTPPSRWKRNKTHENSASVTFYPPTIPPPLLMNVLCSVDVPARERMRVTFVTKKYLAHSEGSSAFKLPFRTDYSSTPLTENCFLSIIKICRRGYNAVTGSGV